MQQDVHIAAVAVDTRPGEIDGNLKTFDRWTAEAADAGAELVLFPELSLSGFVPNHPTGDHDRWLRGALKAAREMAQPIPGSAIDRIVKIAASRRTIVCAGLLEDAGNLLYNSQVVVGPDGLLGVWRKMHVPMFEMPFYNGGGQPTVIDTKLGRLGVNICFDALLPESTRLLAVQNVEIVLFPFAADPPPATADAWADWASPALRARCVENGIFGVACNYVGRVECAGVEQTFPGGGMVIGPRGEIIERWGHPSGQPGMLLAKLRAEELSAARAEPEYLFRFRRPELYGLLSAAPESLVEPRGAIRDGKQS